MKNWYLCLAICLLQPAFLFAQKKYTLKGYIAVPGGESFNYRLIFTDSSGIVDGYSITYQDVDTKETKALIKGSIDRNKNTFSFKETEIVYNHGFESKVVICLVDATLKYEPINKGHVLTGPISSKDAANSYCGGGSISLVNDDVLQLLFSEQQMVKDTVAVPVVKAMPAPPQKPMKIVYDTVRRQAPVVPAALVDKITSGDIKVYNWETDTLTIDIWDGGHIDGDIISLLFNEKPLLANYTLTKDKKQIKIPLLPGSENTLTIIANNEGNEAPNTANLLLTDGAKNYPVIAYNETGRKAIIHIKKK